MNASRGQKERTVKECLVEISVMVGKRTARYCREMVNLSRNRIERSS